LAQRGRAVDRVLGRLPSRRRGGRHGEGLIMWPRVIEGMLGCWLLVTPLVFRGTAAVEDYTTSALVSGAVVIVMALLSFWEPTRLARFATLGVSLWLALHG